MVDAYPDRLQITALAAGGNVERLAEQVRRFRPRLVAVRDAQVAALLGERIGPGVRIVHGVEGVVLLCS